MIKVEAANAVPGEITIDAAANPPTADAVCRGFLRGIHTKSGMQVGYINQQVDLHWVKRNDQWLLKEYTAYYDGQRIDAVGSAAANRPAPATGS
jgi:hypothetical protein